MKNYAGFCGICRAKVFSTLSYASFYFEKQIYREKKTQKNYLFFIHPESKEAKQTVPHDP